MTSALYDNIYFRKDSMMHHTSFLRQKRILQSAIEELEKSPGESSTNFTIHSDAGSSLFFHPSIALHFPYFNLIVCVKCLGTLIARLHRLRQLIVTPQTCFVHMAADSKRLVELHGENTPTGMVPGTLFFYFPHY